MGHPSVAEILALASGELADPTLGAHLAACPSCQALAGLSAPLSDEREAEPLFEADLDELPTVERRFYGHIRPIPEGRGGMGRAFRARDLRLGREVAIKELLEPALLSGPLRDDARRRFEREARLTARLEHPSIMVVYEAGKWPEGEPFYAMPLVRGRPLEEEIEARKSLAERVDLLPSVSAVAEAVAYAHGEGIIHRDIKPQNIMIGPFGEALLIDWGLAKDLHALETPEAKEANEANALPDPMGLTRLGVGTPQYMPPEQARGAPPDARMDIYALGATLYHVLAGVPPYGRGDSGELRQRLHASPPPPLESIAPEVPLELIAIVNKAMARAPEERFATARELADELRRVQTGQLTRTHRYSPAELLRHYLRRHRAAFRVALVGLIVLFALSIMAFVRIARERDRADLARKRAEEGERSAQLELERARGLMASRMADAAASRLDAIALGVRATASRPGADEPPPEALQGLVDALAAGPPLVRLEEPHGSLFNFASSPDGKTLYSSGADGFLRLWDATSGRPLGALRSQLAYPYWIEVSPKGERLLSCGFSDPAAELWDLEARQSVRLEGRNEVLDCRFSSDGGLVFTAETGQATRWDAASGRALDHIAIDGQAVSLAISPTGLVAVGSVGGAITLWDPPRGERARLFGHKAEIGALAFVDAGKTLLSAGHDGRVLGWDVSSAPSSPPRVLREDPSRRFGRRRVLSARDERRHAIPFNTEEGHGPGGTEILDLDHLERELRLEGFATAWISRSRGGDMLAGPDIEYSQLHLWDARSGASLLDFDEHPGHVTTALALVDGDGLVSSSLDGAAYLWDVRAGAATGLLLGHGRDIVAASMARGQLLTASLDGSAWSWDLASGEPLAVVRGKAELLTASFSRDGARFLTAGVDGVVRVYDTEGKSISSLGSPGEPIVFALFSPKGKEVLAGRSDQTATLWNAETGALLRSFDVSGAAITAAAFSPDGGRIALGQADRRVTLWSAASGKRLAATPSRPPTNHDGVHALFFSPDSARLFVGYHAGKGLWLDASNLNAGDEIMGSCASSSAPPFSPDGQHMVTVGGEGRIWIHDLSRGEHVALEGHSRPVLSAAFFADGARLVTGSMDGSARVWDLARRTPLLTLAPRGLGQVTAARPTPDGHDIVVAYSSGALRLYPVTIERARERACAILSRFDRKSDAGEECP